MFEYNASKKHSGYGPEKYSSLKYFCALPYFGFVVISWHSKERILSVRQKLFCCDYLHSILLDLISLSLLLSWPQGIPPSPLLQSRFVGSSTLHLVSGQGQSIEGFPQLFSVWVEIAFPLGQTVSTTG